MRKFKIVKDNVKSLRERSTPVEMPVDNETREILLDMLEYLKLSQNEEYAAKHNIRAGVGLAAPQIGINKQMLAVYIDMPDKKVELCLINPKIISESVKMAYIESGEGCLSVDRDHPGYVPRHYKITLKAYDLLQDKNVVLTFSGFPAMVLQHEIDHLKGVLYYDHIDKVNPFKKINGAIVL